MSSFCSSTRYWTALEICIWQTYVVGPSMGPGSIKPVNDQVSKYSENCNSFRTSPHHVLWWRSGLPRGFRGSTISGPWNKTHMCGNSDTNFLYLTSPTCLTFKTTDRTSSVFFESTIDLNGLSWCCGRTCIRPDRWWVSHSTPSRAVYPSPILTNRFLYFCISRWWSSVATHGSFSYDTSPRVQR